jgi:short-subunit dehydrogenase
MLSRYEPPSRRDPMNLDGSRILLTGATGGLGQAIARGLAERGASLILTGRRADVLEPLAAEIGGQAVVSDLAQPDAVDALLADAGDVDALVANAALPGSGPVLEYSVDEIDRALAVNLRAPIMLARALGERMVARGSGQLVFVSSLSGKAASPGAGIYCATKFGLRGFALGLREDLIGTGVGVSIVYPGFIRGAGMFAESDTKLPPFVGTKSPEDVAKAVAGAIEHDRAEVSVAPFGVRAGAALGGLMPAKAGAIQRRLGAQRIADQMSEGQKSKR